MQPQLKAGRRAPKPKRKGKDRPAWPPQRGVPLEDIPKSPPRWREVLLALLDRYNWAHGRREKWVSFRTMEERRLFLFAFFRELRSYGYWIDPRSLGMRHVDVMLEAWQARGITAGTTQQYLSHLRVFSEWIRKPGMVPDLARLPHPERLRRTCVATKSKAWEANGALPADIIAAADRIDPYVGAQLRMQQAFGLRVKEALMLRPHASVTGVAPDQVLVVERGTKGGRRRELPVDSEAKREAIAHGQALCTGLDQSLADPSRTLLQAYYRFYNVMRQLGVTRKQLGVTAHGLRHGFAAAEYESHAGEPPPVDGGKPVERGSDDAARLAVAEQLGHSRKQITGAYLGSTLVMRRKDRPHTTDVVTATADTK